MEWILLVSALILTYLLYSNGYMYAQSKTATVFKGDGKGQKNRMGFSFTKCSGRVSRVLKVKETGIYCFDLVADLSAGTVQFHVLDGQKQPVLNLNPDMTRARVQLEKGKRYFLKFQFVQASGSCAASWEKE